MAKAKKDAPVEGEIQGRALVDIARIGAKCGEYISVPADIAAELIAGGAFDPKAVQPEQDAE